MSEASESPEPTELVFALCHEIGSLLSATRMNTHLLDPDSTPSELTSIADTISELTSRVGSLLAQIRPILAPPIGDPLHVDPSEVLDGLRRGIDESCDHRVRLDRVAAADLPYAAVDPEPLHNVLLTAVYHALDRSEPDGIVRVSAVAARDSVVFAVEDDGPSTDEDDSVLRGPVLARWVAEAILGERGSRVDAACSAGTNRYTVTVPAAVD